MSEAKTINQQTTKTDEQNTVGYACICGYKETDRLKFNSHIMHAAKQDGKGTHKSLGQINMVTGEIIHGPWASRTEDEKKQTIRKKSDIGAAAASDAGAKTSGAGSEKKEPPPPDPRSNIQQIRVVPKVFTMDYTPIMRAAQDAAAKFFNWRPDMPLENFIDTCLYWFFFEKGITLGAYVVDDRLLKKEA